MNSIHFHEKQKFTFLPAKIIVGLIQVLFLWGLIQQVIFDKPWGVKPASDSALIIINIGVFLLLLLFISIKLKTDITEENISFQMLPFQIRKRSIPWNKVQQARVIKYDGFNEYWGFGIKYMRGKGWCYTLPGEYGIKLILKNGKQILIGTDKPKELHQTVKKIKEHEIIIDNKKLIDSKFK
jgi:hypothetical protein